MKIYYRIISKVIVVLFVVTNLTTYSYASDTTYEKIDDEKSIVEEITKSYMNDEMFILHLKEDEKEALLMLERIIDYELEHKNDDIHNIKADPIQSCQVPAIQQSVYNWCSIATTLQTLYGMDLEGQVSGTSYSAKQSTLYSEYGGLPLVYQLRNKLNTYISSSTYSYINGSSLTDSTFQSKVHTSLSHDRPILLHAKTEALPYYNNINYDHYLSLDESNTLSDTVRIVDCNWNNSYFGVHSGISVSDARDTLPSGRYLIYGN